MINRIKHISKLVKDKQLALQDSFKPSRNDQTLLNNVKAYPVFNMSSNNKVGYDYNGRAMNYNRLPSIFDDIK